ncbi:MAG: glycosyltransferase, partial [Bacteroides thetaiotaomicron]|nr:glycosyltransferase [Bacteroides thetaiotaomicron]
LIKYNQGIIFEAIVIANPTNLGTVKAFNIALRHTKGIYIFNLAADDLFYDRDVLTEWVAEFIKRDAQFMVGRMAVYDSGMRHFQNFFPPARYETLLEKGNEKSLFEALAKKNFIIGCSCARSKTLIEQHGDFDEEFSLLEDYPYALRMVREHVRIHYWKRPVIRYRQGGISAAQNFNAVYMQESDLNFKKEILPYTRHPLRIRLFYLYWKIDRKEEKKFIQCRQQIRDSGRQYLIPLVYMRFPVFFFRAIKRRTEKILLFFIYKKS